MSESLELFLKVIPLLIFSAVLHEVSHGWVALRLGDSTAQRAGRLTLNPLRHLDPVGTVFVPLLLLFLRSPFLFAWAKPVPINVLNLRHPKRDMLWVGASGPLANFMLAAVVAFALRWIGPLGPGWVEGMTLLVFINVLLGVFNLVPIPPLDGARVLAGLAPVRALPFLFRLERWGMVLIVVLLFLGFFRKVLLPIVLGLTYALLGMAGVEGAG